MCCKHYISTKTQVFDKNIDIYLFACRKHAGKLLQQYCCSYLCSNFSLGYAFVQPLHAILILCACCYSSWYSWYVNSFLQIKQSTSQYFSEKKESNTGSKVAILLSVNLFKKMCSTKYYFSITINPAVGHSTSGQKPNKTDKLEVLV